MCVPWPLVPLHRLGDLVVGSPLLLLALLAIAGVGASVVVGLALAVFVRRRSQSYLLVTLAVATLLARTVVASLSLYGTLDWEVIEDGELTIWGYDDFEVYEARENGLPGYDGGIVTHEFLRELADYVPIGAEQ